MIPENIISLGHRETEIRTQSLAAVVADKMLSDHVDAVGKHGRRKKRREVTDHVH